MTNEKRIEELIEENDRLREEIDTISERLNLSLSAGNLAWWEWDIKENRVQYNRMKVEMLGYTVEDFKDCGFEAFTALVHPDDHSAAMEAMRKHMTGKAPLYEVEYRIRAKNGEYKWYYDRGSITERDDSGAPLCAKGIVFDITEKKKVELYKNQLIYDLNKALKEIKTLRGILPICSYCKKVRDDNGYWEQVENYISDKSDADFSHTVCPSCLEKHFPEIKEKGTGENI
ncbi:MAG: PAS domain-containing protein [Fibrobacterota bacterium]